jgi:hypothetical protein
MIPGRLTVVPLILGCLGLPATAAAAGQTLITLKLHGQAVEGLPLSWNADAVHLLARDGRLWEFRPDEARDFQRSSDTFHSLSVSQLRATLLRELGQTFDVTGTGHYMVAHPRGQREQWAERFEDLYRSFVHFFAVRKHTPAEPVFPLVVIVCHNQGEFLRYSASQGVTAGTGILGYYALQSNRILLYDASAGGTSPHNWRQNAAVAIHEATHQTAFNTGIHSRFTPPPKWVAEGLATMFEAPGVHDSRLNLARNDRLNHQRLDSFLKSVLPRVYPEMLRELVGSDQLFQASPGAAYAEAWALSFYLNETQPQKYLDYVARTARYAPFTTPTAAERLADFTALFGNDWTMLQSQWVRFFQNAEFLKP